MKYIEINVKTAKIVHGFDEYNKEILESINEAGYVRKIIAIQ